MPQTLEQYLQGRSTAPDAAVFRSNWETRRDQYLDEVRRLYDNIKTWLRPLILDGLVNIGEGTVRLTEDLETYDAPELNIFLSDQAILMRAVGTNIFGGYGRVDILGPKGTAYLFLQNWGHWKLARPEYRGFGPSLTHYSDISEDAFKNLLYLLIAE